MVWVAGGTGNRLVYCGNMVSDLIALEAEKIIIGSVLLNTDNYWQLSQILKPQHFSDEINRRIFEIIGDLASSGKQPSIPMIERRMEGVQTSGVVLPIYLQTLVSRIMDDPPDPVDYAGEIVDTWMRRSIIEAAETASKQARDLSSRSDEVISTAEASLADISREDAQSEITYRDAVQAAVKSISDAYQNDKALGFDSGLPSLDEITGRFLPGDLVIIGGAAGHGKTALGMQLMEHISGTGRALIFQLEMTPVGIAMRGLAAHTGISASSMEEGNINEAEFDQIYAFQEQAAQADMTIVTRDRTVAQMKSKAMAHKKSGRLAAVLIDHLRLMDPEPGKRYYSDLAAIADHCSGLKKMAKDLEIPVFLVCQRTRGSQKRDDDKPRSTDLYGGVIEQDADIIIMPYRRYDKLKISEPVQDRDPDAYFKWSQELAKWKDLIEIYQTKRRRGEGNNSRTFNWNALATRFEER